jgi:two-component system, NarL family, sensor histidine kinase UhpB
MNSKKREIRAKIPSFCIALLISAIPYAQSSNIDSLKKVLQTQQNDTGKVNCLHLLARKFRFSNTDTAIVLIKEGLDLAVKLRYEMGIANLQVTMGALYADKGNYNEGLKFANEALELYKKMLWSATDPYRKEILRKMGAAYNVLGHNSIAQGNYPEGLKNSLLALKIREEIGDKKGISDTEYNLGNIYYSQHNYDEALKHYKVSLKLSEELGIKRDISSVYNTIGAVYFAQHKYADALKTYMVSLKITEELDDKKTMIELYANLAAIKDKQADFSEAMRYYRLCLKTSEAIHHNEMLPFIYNGFAGIYIKQKKLDDASVCLDKALAMSLTSGSLEYLKLTYENFASLDSAKGDYKNALKHYKLFVAARDSMFNIENAKKIAQQQMQYDFDKKADSLRQSYLITATKLQAQKNQKYFYWGGLVMLALLLFFAFNNFLKQKKINRLAADAHAKQKTELELQNTQALLSERLRISSELHDEVGATLSGISMYSHLTKEQMKHAQTAAVEKSLNIMQESSGDMVNKLNDIVWLLNPVQDTLQKLIQRLEEYAGEMTAIKNMKFQTAVPDQFLAQSLPVESRRNIYLFCKEAINNAVKYSEAGLLGLTVKENSNLLEVIISDNGKGFDVESVKRGNGLDNMQKRADELGADFNIQSKHCEGCVVSLKLKITQ